MIQLSSQAVSSNYVFLTVEGLLHLDSISELYTMTYAFSHFPTHGLVGPALQLRFAPIKSHIYPYLYRLSRPRM
jgi:hypothetical protein